MPPTGVRVHRAQGSPSVVQISEQLDRFLINAPERKLTFRGERTDVASAFPGLAVNTVQSTYRQDGASATIDVILKDSEAIVDVLEIDFNTVSRDVFFSPGYAGLTKDNRVAILGKLKVLDAYANDDTHSPAQIESKRASLAAELGGIVGQAFNDIIANGDSYIALLPVITFTRTVAINFGTPFVIVDMGKVFSTTSMIANLPLNPQLAVEEVTNTIFANPLQTLGWLKTGRYQVASDGGVQYIQQYTFDAYPTARYLFV